MHTPRPVLPKRYFRFELAFDGEAQNIGFLTGIDDIGLDIHCEVELLAPFESLPCPHIHTRCEFWFTEDGLCRYQDALMDIARTIRKKNWQLIYAVFDASEEDLGNRVYCDKWQAAWPIEYLNTNKAGFKEVGCIRADIRKCCVYPPRAKQRCHKIHKRKEECSCTDTKFHTGTGVSSPAGG